MRLTLVLFLIIQTAALFGQEQVKDFIKKNTVPVLSISPDSTNYRDLEPIGNTIGDAKVVMLGEQDHGDAPTFLAKTRLVKYLHEKKGFNVLAFESDFFGLNEGWDKLDKNTDSINTFLKANIFGVWTDCNTCSNLLFNYIPNSYRTANPLIISGFDSQMILGYSFKILMKEFDSVLKRLQIPITKSNNYITEVFPMLDTINHLLRLPDDTTIYSKRNFYLNEIKSQLREVLPENDFWMLVNDNLIQNNVQMEYQKIDYWKSINARDKQMALNLKWLSDVKYSNEKIIVWAQNFHISKFSGNFDAKFLKQQVSMGTWFTNDSNDLNKTYCIGFTSYEGTTARNSNKPYNLDQPKSNSFENWIDKSCNYAFADFKKYNQLNPNIEEPFFMQGSLTGNTYHKNFKAQWNKIFDGVFFIREMYPCQ